MSRFPQRPGTRGSLKWLQIAVNERPDLLDGPILSALPGAGSVAWRSPLAADGFAEYRDAAFLDRLGLGAHAGALAAFWPARGPQWDALAITGAGQVLLVEAKAHLRELASPPLKAGPASRARIVAALAATAAALGARPLAPWTDAFYQLANRLAHLVFLRGQGVDARLVLVNFVGDTEMGGPAGKAEWQAAYAMALHVMGLPVRHRLSRYVLPVYPDVGGLAAVGAA